MTATPDKVVPKRRPFFQKPFPAWPDLRKDLGREPPRSSKDEAPSREWRDLVADMIIGRR